ncbi:1853_t:CDS:1, partial [Dentiscutata erythropus]
MISTIIDKVKELINQQAENQRGRNEQLQHLMDNRFSQLEQINWSNTTRQSRDNLPPDEGQASNASPITVCSAMEAREELPQGNYPFTPTLNHILANMVQMSEVISTSNVNENEKSRFHADKSSIIKKG